VSPRRGENVGCLGLSVGLSMGLLWGKCGAERGAAVGRAGGRAWPRCAVSVSVPWVRVALPGWARGCGAGEAQWGEWGFAARHPGTAAPRPPGWSCSARGQRTEFGGCRGEPPPGTLAAVPFPRGPPAESGSARTPWGGTRGCSPDRSAVGTRAALRGGSAAPRKYSLAGAGGRDAARGRLGPPCAGPAARAGCTPRRALPSCPKSRGVPAGASPAPPPRCRAGGCRCSASGTPL